eukprot:GHRR01018752.1.p2 GENE.GHRR01018752.1~~GHRR01018752.1.p2  ORF type:complete len:119 (-),score=23.23 GHRR01018752.1:155-511(-)
MGVILCIFTISPPLQLVIPGPAGIGQASHTKAEQCTGESCGTVDLLHAGRGQCVTVMRQQCPLLCSLPTAGCANRMLQHCYGTDACAVRQCRFWITSHVPQLIYYMLDNLQAEHVKHP